MSRTRRSTAIAGPQGGTAGAQPARNTPGHRARVALGSLVAASLLAACAATGPGGQAAAPVEPRAGAWLRTLAGARDAAALERIRYWDAGSPAYRWNEVAIETCARNNTTSVPGARAFTLMSVAIDDALVAAWNAKYAHNRFGQYGMPGTHLFWSREASRKVFEQGLDTNPPRAARFYALVRVAHYDATIASQDAKYAYWTARPTQFDPTITTVMRASGCGSASSR